MTMLADRFRRWFEYERDSHGKALASLEALSKDQPNVESDERFQKCVDLLAHIAAARELWLFRFGVSETGPSTADELFPKGHDLSEARAALDAMQTKWVAYLEGIDDEELSRVFEYQSVEGPRFKNSIEELFTQLFGHSWYHRGQIASHVRSLGGEPAVTDFVDWSRVPM
ncbi:MAG: hypothetical protein E2P02_27240 [Acidobacteria bacterium]|nr:MAG: hypothetical protein E2P02_27240 [Acidobacteriota bacterium]